MGMGCARAFFASQGWRAVLQDATPYPPPLGRDSREGPGVRAILAAPLALKAGPGPLPPHATSNSGAGPPMASASPGGELATLPGAVLAVGGPVLCAVTPSTRSCGGRMPPQSPPWMALARTDPGTAQPPAPATAEGRWRCVEGRWAAIRGPWRGLTAPRRQPAGVRATGRSPAPPGPGSRDGGPLFAGHATSRPPRESLPARGSGLFWPLPWPAGEVKPRRWAAICGPRPGLSAPTAPAAGVAGYAARDPGQCRT